jgi:hypothetical protein
MCQGAVVHSRGVVQHVVRCPGIHWSSYFHISSRLCSWKPSTHTVLLISSLRRVRDTVLSLDISRIPAAHQAFSLRLLRWRCCCCCCCCARLAHQHSSCQCPTTSSSIATTAATRYLTGRNWNSLLDLDQAQRVPMVYLEICLSRDRAQRVPTRRARHVAGISAP